MASTLPVHASSSAGGALAGASMAAAPGVKRPVASRLGTTAGGLVTAVVTSSAVGASSSAALSSEAGEVSRCRSSLRTEGWRKAGSVSVSVASSSRVRRETRVTTVLKVSTGVAGALDERGVETVAAGVLYVVGLEGL